MVQSERNVEMNPRDVSLQRHAFDSILVVDSILNLGDAMERVVELIDSQYMIPVGVVVHKHAHQSAIGVVCDAMHVHGIPHEGQLVVLDESVVVLIVVGEDDGDEVIHSMNLAAVVLQVGHVLMVEQQQIVLQYCILVQGARRLPFDALAHITDGDCSAHQTPVAIQLAEVRVKLPVAAANVSSSPFIVENAFALAHATWHVRRAYDAFHSFRAVVHQAGIYEGIGSEKSVNRGGISELTERH